MINFIPNKKKLSKNFVFFINNNIILKLIIYTFFFRCKPVKFYCHEKERDARCSVESEQFGEENRVRFRWGKHVVRVIGQSTLEFGTTSRFLFSSDTNGTTSLSHACCSCCTSLIRLG